MSFQVNANAGLRAVRAELARAYCALGDVERDSGRLDLAAAAYRRAAVLCGYDRSESADAGTFAAIAAAFAAFGDEALCGGDSARAADLYLRALTASSACVSAYRGLAVLHEAAGRSGAARAARRRAGELDKPRFAFRILAPSEPSRGARCETATPDPRRPADAVRIGRVPDNELPTDRLRERDPYATARLNLHGAGAGPFTR